MYIRTITDQAIAILLNGSPKETREHIGRAFVIGKNLNLIDMLSDQSDRDVILADVHEYLKIVPELSIINTAYQGGFRPGELWVIATGTGKTTGHRVQHAIKTKEQYRDEEFGRLLDNLRTLMDDGTQTDQTFQRDFFSLLVRAYRQFGHAYIGEHLQPAWGNWFSLKELQLFTHSLSAYTRTVDSAKEEGISLEEKEGIPYLTLNMIRLVQSTESHIQTFGLRLREKYRTSKEVEKEVRELQAKAKEQNAWLTAFLEQLERVVTSVDGRLWVELRKEVADFTKDVSADDIHPLLVMTMQALDREDYGSVVHFLGNLKPKILTPKAHNLINMQLVLGIDSQQIHECIDRESERGGLLRSITPDHTASQVEEINRKIGILFEQSMEVARKAVRRRQRFFLSMVGRRLARETEELTVTTVRDLEQSDKLSLLLSLVDQEIRALDKAV